MLQKTGVTKDALISLLQSNLSEKISTEDLHFHKVTIYSAINSLSPDSSMTTKCYATPAFHGSPRYDSVQVSADDNQKWFGKLVLVFEIQVNMIKHQLALIRQYDLVSEEKSTLLNLPHVTLSNVYNLIPVDAIDQLVYVHPTHITDTNFLIDIDVQE